jgi:hypothetical protein
MVIATSQHLNDAGAHLRRTDNGAQTYGHRELQTAGLKYQQ